MKILLTVVVCLPTDNAQFKPLYDGIELFYPDKGETEKDFLARSIKSAKGKYTVICDRAFKLADVQSVLNIIDKNTADMVCFTGGTAIKTSILRGLKDYPDEFACRVSGVLGCKNLLKTDYTPFTFEKEKCAFTDENTAGILRSAALFGKVKSKLNKEIYAYAFNMLCDKLVLYYLYAMLAIKDGSLPAEKLIEFDNKLKAEIVLYLALEKRFTYARLQKLRDKNFKLSWFTARKFAKVLG